jgi:hypothetical protein
MPKTKINYPTAQVDLVYDNDPAQGSDLGNGASVTVGWSKEADWVQVGLEVNVSYARFAAEYPTAPGRTVMWTPVLTDEEIDRLIKALRKAKRQTRGPRLIG